MSKRRVAPWMIQLVLALVLVVMACARMGSPPGGPPDAVAPKLLGTFPESVEVVPNYKGWVEFRFDETVDEGAQPNFRYGTGTLEQLVLLSPDTLVPDVRWARSRILVRPHRGWKPNTVYRIELLAGVRDLRGNIDRSGVSVTLATGGEKPTHYVSGRAIDWIGQRGGGAALIQLMHLPEKTVYRSSADTSGRFHIGPLPSGEYLVEAVLGGGGQFRRRGPKDSWDTVRVPAASDSTGEIWAFPRDTNKPKSTKADRVDTMGIALTMSFPVDPNLKLPPDSITIWAIVGERPDSQVLFNAGAFTQAVYDSLWKQAPPPRPADSTGRGQPPPTPVVPPAGRGSGARNADPPSQQRPPLNPRLVVRSRVGLRPSVKYAIQVRGVRLVGGATGTINAILPVVPTAAADSVAKAKAKADSIRKADSVRTAGGRGRGGGGLYELRQP